MLRRNASEAVQFPCSFAHDAVESWRSVAQNPGSVKAGEEVLRLTKKIKTAETEVVAKRAQAKRQAEDVAKLQLDLDKIKAGAAQDDRCISVT